MQLHSLLVRGAERRMIGLVATVAVAGMAACGQSSDTVTAPTSSGPALPGNPVQVPSLRNSAFIADVDVSRKIVKIRTPDVNISAKELEAMAASRGKTGSTPSLSILGKDVISITTANFYASPLGAITPGKVRVYFDVTINNNVAANLVTPTFPDAPPGQNGLLLFPFSAVAVTTTGGLGIENDNVVVVELPRGGAVDASPDWNGNGAPDTPSFPTLPGAGGSPWNFFNDASCTAVPDAGTTSDCFRYETFGPVASGGTSITRRVGFDVDGTVGQFRARLIAAADLIPAATPVGNVTVTISSSQRPAAYFNTASVSISGVAGSSTFTNGTVTISNVAAGSRTVTISGIPAACNAATLSPASPTTISVVASATTTQAYTITCTPELGTVTGAISRQGTGTQSLAGITYTVTPTGGAAISGTTTGTGASVSFSQGNVPVLAGTGSVTIGNIPTDCSVTSPASGTATYAGLVDGGTQNVSFQVTCNAPLPTYVARAQWGAISGGTVDLTLSWDPTGCTAANPFCVTPGGATPAGVFGGVGAIVQGTGSGVSRLTSYSSQPTPNFGVPTLGTLGLSTGIGITAVSTASNTTAQNYAIIRFTVGAGSAGSVTTVQTITEISTPGGDAYTLSTSGASKNLNIIEATLNIP